MEYYLVTWLVLSVVGFIASIMLVTEAEADLDAIDHTERHSRYLRALARSHFIQELLLLAQMAVAMLIGIMGAFGLFTPLIVPALVILLSTATGSGIFRLAMRKRLMRGEE